MDFAINIFNNLSTAASIAVYEYLDIILTPLARVGKSVHEPKYHMRPFANFVRLAYLLLGSRVADIQFLNKSEQYE
jgi:hypothetical protein